MEKMEEITVYCDGGARGNPGPAASAFVVEKDGKVIKKESSFIGVATNNVAEYQAVILALKWLVENSEIRYKQSLTRANARIQMSDVRFVLDSELVVRQLNGLYKVKNEVLRNLFFTIKTLEKKINAKINYTSVTREKNKLADFFVNEKLDQAM